jgi:hypothetical protein
MMVEHLDLVFGIKKLHKRGKDLEQPIWTMSRPTAYRLVKRVMNRAGIKGKQATGKGLRIRCCHGDSQKAVTSACNITIDGAFRHKDNRNLFASGR